MRPACLVLSLASLLLTPSVLAASEYNSENSPPVPLIIDTDIGGGGCMDVDDVAAVCMAHALEDNGEAKLLAMVQDTNPKGGAGVLSVLNHFYGRDSIPIGAYKGAGLSKDSPFLPYVTNLVEHYPSPIKNTSQVPSAVDVYREVLVKQVDHSVHISSIGILTNLEDLLKSPADQFSSLSGYELVRQKVKMLAVMGGKYPGSEGSPECNFCGCAHADSASAATAAASTAYVFSHMPPEVEIVYSGFEIGIQVQSGGRLTDCASQNNPCRQAFIDYGGRGQSRYSWDPLSTLVAVRGTKGAHCSECTDCDGVNEVDSRNGDNSWKMGATSSQSYLVLDDAKAAGDAIDQLLCQPPKHQDFH